MKKIIDLLQIVLLEGGLFGFLACAVMAWAIFQSLHLVGAALRMAIVLAKAGNMLIWKPTGARLFMLLSLSAVVYLFSAPISTELQYIEQMYVSPTYTTQDTSFYALSVYETQLKRNVSEHEFKIVQDSTAALAAELGCTPLAIYEVAYSECALNPFRVRDDGKAAGWIQFTNVGASGLGFTKADAIQCCRDRDAKKMMEYTGKYMRRAAKGRKLLTATDVYCAVFAPGMIGAGIDATLYEGWSNDAYTLNKGLDGYFIEGDKALFLPSRRDGKITLRDMQAALAYKRAKLIGRI